MAIVSLWRLSSNGTDSVGTNNGVGISMSYVSSPYGQVGKFNGSSSTVSIPNASSLQVTGSFSHECVISIDAQPSTGQHYKIYDDSGGPAPHGVYTHYFNQPPGQIQMGYNNTGVGITYPLTVGKYYHVIYTHDSTTSVDNIFVNGQIIMSATGKTLQPIAKNTTKYIGCELGGFKFFNGKIGRVCLYNNAMQKGSAVNKFLFLRGYI